MVCLASLDLGALLIRIQADSTQALEGMQGVATASSKHAKSVTTDWAEVGKSLTNIGKTMTLAISVPLVGALTAAIKYASDLTETISKTQQVFGSLSDEILDWSDTSIDSMGMAQQTALDMASTFGDLGTSMGLSKQASADMSMSLTQLAADMASFKNISLDRANTALAAIYTGETESLKAMGVVMTDANLALYAANAGYATQYSEMSQAEKVMLRYRYVMDATTNAQGDFARTSDSLANQSRKLGQSVKELAAVYGGDLEDSATSVIKLLNEAVNWMSNLDEGTRRTILTVVEIVAAVGAAVLVVGTVITAITKLQAALTALAANPVTATILAITAVVVALGVVVANVSGAIAETNAELAKLDGMEAEVKIALDKSNAEIDVGKTDDFDTNLAEIQSDIDTVAKAEAYVAEIVATGVTTDSTFTTLQSVITELTTDPMYAYVIGQGEDGNGTMSRLGVLYDKLQNKTFTISGNNSDLLALQGILQNVTGGLNALTVYENQQHRIQMAVEDPTGSAKALKQACADILGYDGEDVTIDFLVQTAIANAGTLNGALATVITSSQTWTTNLDVVKTALQEVIDSSKTSIENLGKLQVLAAFEAYSSGNLTLDQLNTTLHAVSAQTQALIGDTEGASAAWDAFNAAMTNGNPDDDTAAILAFQQAMSGLKTTTEETEDPAKKVAQATSEISEYMSSGATDADAMGGSVANLNSGLTTSADNMESGVKSAYDTYQTSVKNANQAEADGITAVDNSIAKKKEAQEALSTYSTLITENSGDTEAAMTALKEFSQAEYDAVVEYYGGFEEAVSTPISEIEDAAYTMQFDLTEAEKQAETDRQTVRDTANKARTDAETQLGTDLSTIQSGYSVEELQAIINQQTQIGNTEGAAAATRLQKYQAFTDGAGQIMSDGSADIVSYVETMIDDIAAQEDDMGKTGIDVGEAWGAGVYLGMNNWLDKIKKKAAQIIKDATAAAKKAEESSSPAKLPAREVGAPFVQGIDVGAEGEMPKLLANTRRRMGQVISAGAEASARIRQVIAGGSSITNTTSTTNSPTIKQENHFDTHALTPYEQRMQVRKLNKDLLNLATI